MPAPRTALLSFTCLVVALGACEGDPGVAPEGDTVSGDAAEVTEANPGLGVDYSATSGGVVARYEPDGAGFTATPWPSDRHRRPDGTVDLTVVPNPNGVPFIADYLTYGSTVIDGYSRNGAVYFQLSGLLDPASLPTDADAMNDPRALVQLVDLTPGGPDHGRRWPLLFKQVPGGDDPHYLGPTLVVRPVYGFPLADGGTYCAFLTRALVDADGAYLEPAPAFADALATDPSLAPLRAWTATAPIAAHDLAAATCFTTQDATRDMRRIQAFLETRPTGPVADVTNAALTTHYHELEATYRGPNFQRGTKPYTSEGGDLVLDDDGLPVVQEDELIRVRVVVPRNAQMPDAGWPVVIYSHGTGGDWRSCLDTNDTEISREGLVILCIDQPLHGIRGVGDDDNYLNSFNFLNPESGRMSFRQAAADTIWLARMIADGRFDLAAADTGLAADLRLDPATIVFFGHSHGGLAGILVLGVDPRVKGAVLSGSSGVLAETIIRRKDPIDIANLLATILGVRVEQLDTFHPIITVAQTIVDATDPINYAPFWLNPTSGGRAKHVLMTAGTLDDASPSVGAAAVAAAAGIPLITPVIEASRAHELRALAPVTMPVHANLITSTGALITGGLLQRGGGDHWVALEDIGTRLVWRGFLRAFRAGDIPAISP